ncbi:hypothetical protein RBA19_21480, partial [Mycobacteroides abscessus subsp. massiliense]
DFLKIGDVLWEDLIEHHDRLSTPNVGSIESIAKKTMSARLAPHTDLRNLQRTVGKKMRSIGSALGRNEVDGSMASCLTSSRGKQY